MKRIQSIKLVHKIDTYTDLSYLGEFSDTPEPYAIEHTQGERNSYKWFNPANVETQQQAQQNYDRMMSYNDGELCDYGIYAVAEVQTGADGASWLCNSVQSGGLWGVNSDADAEYFTDVEQEQLAELKTLLLELGFTSDEINSVEIQKAND